jgi:hypothetical protein
MRAKFEIARRVAVLAVCWSTITCEAASPPSPATISLSPTTLSFDGVQGQPNPAAKTVSVSNSGGGDLSWTATSNAGWLVATPASGTAPTTLTLTPSIAGLTAGNHSATVTIAGAGATNSPQTVTATLTLAPPPSIALSATTFTFSGEQGAANPSNQTLSITNTGGGTLTWTATSNSPWLTLTPSSGTGAATVTLAVSTSGLTAGTYNGTVTVAATGADNTPMTASVTLTVTPPPRITLSPASITFSGTQGGSNPATQALNVSNGGGGTLAWSASDDASWLSLSPTSGTGAGGITLSVNTSGLSAGTYNGKITVTASGASNTPQTVDVTLNVTVPPQITLSPGTFSFSAQQGGSNPATQALDISNGGGGTLAWSVSSDASWLTPSPTSGTGAAGVTLSVNTSGLAAGTHNAKITVSAAGATNTPRTVDVTLTLSANYNGSWSGKTAIDSVITFQVQSNAITTITLGWHATSSGCTVDGKTTSNLTTPIPITDGTFNRTVSGNPTSYTISGTFSSGTAVSGNLVVNFSQNIPGVSSCTASSTTTWNATKQ